MTERAIVLDARMVGPKPVGIGTYVSLLVRGLAMGPELPYRLVLLTAPDVPAVHPAGWAGADTRVVRAPFLSAAEQFELPRVLRSIAGADARVVYHSPSFSSLFRCPVPWMITVHDLIHLRFGNAAQKLYYQGLVRRFVRGASARMTVSEHSRREIARWARVPADTIEIVNGAVDPGLIAPPSPSEVERVLGAHGLEPGRFLLCISSPKRHKNVSTLVEAYRSFRAGFGDADAALPPLVLNISGYESVPGVRGTGTLPSSDLKILLSTSSGFFFPSRCEGFGFPPLEAAVAGAPVVLSDIAPLREALAPFGEGELTWLDPDDVPAWTEAIRRAAAGELPRPSEAGRSRAFERFSPVRLATAMDRIYRRVLGIEAPESRR